METAKPLPTVSVCISCHLPYIQYLPECLSSIASQTVLPEEVILVVPESNPFIEEYVTDQIHPFIESLRITCKFFPEKQSTGTNRNKAIDEASGDIIVSMNAYDAMLPDKISVIKNTFLKDPLIVALLNYYLEYAPFCKNETEQSENKWDASLEQPTLFDESLLEQYVYDPELHFSQTAFNSFIFNKYFYTARPMVQDVELIEQILPEHEQNLFIYKAPLSRYMSIRSASLNDYSKRMYDLFLYKLYTLYKSTKTENKLPSVSVCIPCIPKHVEHLHGCLSSIADQKSLPKEVILVVSESTAIVEQQVMDQIKKFSEKLNIKCKFFPNKQYAGTNRNEAIELATGEVISFIDADDEMCEDRISKLQEIFSLFPFAVCVLHHFIENPDSPISSTPFDINLVMPYIYNDEIHSGHASFRNSILKGENKFSYTSKPRGQDVELIEKIASKHKENILIYSKPLTLYMSNRSSHYHVEEHQNSNMNSVNSDSKETNDCPLNDARNGLSFHPFSPSWHPIIEKSQDYETDSETDSETDYETDSELMNPVKQQRTWHTVMENKSQDSKTDFEPPKKQLRIR